MRQRTLKNQIVVFGQFNFPPVPEITLSLMQSFTPFGFMPLVVQQLDQNGQMQPKISLTKADTVQIIFSNDRIDFFEHIPTGNTSIESFYANVMQYLACLQSRNLIFTRLAIVHENLIYELTHEERERLRAQYAPLVPAESIEWQFRWVKPENHDGELMNVCLDVSRLQGILSIANKIEQFDGIKITHDVSYSPSNMVPRFNFGNLAEGFARLLSVVRQQVASSNPQV